MSNTTLEQQTTANAVTLALAETQTTPEHQAELFGYFNPIFEECRNFAEKAFSLNVSSIDDKATMKAAREARLLLKAKRIEVENLRKDLKSEALRTGQAIDAVAKVLKEHISNAENHLKEQEDYAKRVQEELKAKRYEILSQYKKYCDITTYHKTLGQISEEEFDILHDDIKVEYEFLEKEEKEEKARKAAEAKAKAEEDARIRAELARVKAEQRAAEEEALKEKQRAAEEQRKKLEALRAAEAAKAAQERAERELQAQIERAERELQEQIEREIRIQERRAAFELELSKLAAKVKLYEDADFNAAEIGTGSTDKEKLTAALDALKGIEVTDLESINAKKVWKQTQPQLNALIKMFSRAIENLK